MYESFDQEGLMERLDGDVEFLVETVEMLEEDAPDLLAGVDAAVAANDAAALAIAAHTLKGMVANFCAEPAQALALRLEQAGREAALDGTVELAEELKSEVTQLLNDLRACVEAMN